MMKLTNQAANKGSTVILAGLLLLAFTPTGQAADTVGNTTYEQVCTPQEIEKIEVGGLSVKYKPCVDGAIRNQPVKDCQYEDPVNETNWFCVVSFEFDLEVAGPAGCGLAVSIVLDRAASACGYGLNGTDHVNGSYPVEKIPDAGMEFNAPVHMCAWTGVGSEVPPQTTDWAYDQVVEEYHDATSEVPAPMPDPFVFVPPEEDRDNEACVDFKHPVWVPGPAEFESPDVCAGCQLEQQVEEIGQQVEVIVDGLLDPQVNGGCAQDPLGVCQILSEVT